MSQQPTSKPSPPKGYQCQDCSYRSAKGFPDGRCPGCGSFNVKRLGQEAPHPPQPMARKNFRLGLMIALWLYMVFLIWERIQQI